MESTVIGPYPRVGSDYADKLRKEVNRLYGGQANAEIVRKLQGDLTREVVREMSVSGISLPNHGLIDVYDELTWVLEHVDGVRFGGMKKIFHTNTHYREAIVTGRLTRRESLVSDLYKIALEVHKPIKLEFPGPFTIAKHSVMTKSCPYGSLRELAEAYTELFREELLECRDVSVVQFNEPSLIALGTNKEAEMMPELYKEMLDGINSQAVVWTYYGRYSAQTLDILLSLPVDVVGIDFVWNPDIDKMLQRRLHDKKLGLGLIDSGDQGYVQIEDPEAIMKRILELKGHVDFDNSLVSCNATLEHLPRDYARRKIAVIDKVARMVN